MIIVLYTYRFCFNHKKSGTPLDSIKICILLSSETIHNITNKEYIKIIHSGVLVCLSGGSVCVCVSEWVCEVGVGTGGELLYIRDIMLQC